MNNKVDYAVECFNSGFNCSQAVLTAFCKDFGVNTELGLKIAGSFGGGMGHMGGVCGAVSGALMVLGLKYGQSVDYDKYSKARNYLSVNEFAARFRKLNGTINCSELIGYNLGDEAQLMAAREANIWESKCVKYIKDSVSILEEMLAEDSERVSEK